MSHLTREARILVRKLLRSPTFTLLSILTLAVGIGANGAIFSVVEAVLLRPLPYPESERLVGLWHSAPEINPKFEQSDGTYLLYRRESHVFEDVGIYAWTRATLTGDGRPERVPASRLPPAALAQAIRSAVWDLDDQLPTSNVRGLEALVADASARTAFTTLLLLIASVVALVLGVVGLYGVVSFVVSRRTQEIGVRMALGADRATVSRMVLGQGLVTALAGVALGLAGAFALTRLLAASLYGVSPTDPLTFVAVPLVLLGAALLASFLPARRAASVDPLVALRYE